MSDQNKYLVTFVETVVVHADTDDQAVGKAEALRAFAGPDTEDIQVEELED